MKAILILASLYILYKAVGNKVSTRPVPVTDKPGVSVYPYAVTPQTDAQVFAGSYDPRGTWFGGYQAPNALYLRAN